MNETKFCVIIPIRGISTSMTRLREDKSDKYVNSVVKRLFEHTLDIITIFDYPICIVTAQEDILADLSSKNLMAFVDDGTNLNHAINGAINELDFDRYLLIMPDLPGLSSDSISKIIHLNQLHENIIVPTEDGGTAIALLTQDLFSTDFLGENSSQSMIAYCEDKKISISKIHIQELAVDLDDINDLNYWKSNDDQGTII